MDAMAQILKSTFRNYLEGLFKGVPIIVFRMRDGHKEDIFGQRLT